MNYVLADIHGNERRFNSIMKQINLQEEDTLYVLGDVIDRHSGGIRILRRIMAMPNTKMLLGNHEYMMLRALGHPYDPYDPTSELIREDATEHWYRNGGKVTHDHWKRIRKSLRNEILHYLLELPLNIDVEVNGIVYKLVHGAPMGCSQGGFVSALVAAKHPGLVSKLVLFYPALCIPDDARAGKMMFAKFDPKNIPERINCGPMKLGRCYPADVIAIDPIKEISTYRGPVLIVHGTKDTIVNSDYSRQAQRAYPNAKLHIIEGGAHGFGKKHDAIAIAHLRRFAGRDGK